MKKIIQFVRDDGAIFDKNENGTFSMLPRHENHINHEWSEECLLSHRPVIKPVYEKCECHFCTDTFPRIEAITAALPTQELRDSFNRLMEEMGTLQLDLDVAEARLAGEWPGSEWIKEAKEQHLKK